MRIIDTARRAGRSLKQSKARTILTSLAIAVGGFAITVSLMAGEGARQYVDRVISANMDPNSLMIARDKQMVGMSTSGPATTLKEYNPNSMNMWGAEFEVVSQDDIEKLRSRSDLENVEPLYQLEPKYTEFSVQPDKKYVARIQVRDSTLSVAVAGGESLERGVQLANDEATIPEIYLEELGVSASKAVGSTVTVTVPQTVQQPDEDTLRKAFERGGEEAVNKLLEAKETKKTFKVVAVTKKTADQISSPMFIYISPESAKDLAEFATKGTDQYQKYLGVTATVKDGNDPEEIKTLLKKEGLEVATAKDLQGMLFSFINILQNIVLGFGVLALIVSIFGIINTQYISVLERTQQIGLMKALGARQRDIGRLFRFEAAWIGFIGGALGVLIAWAAATVFNPFISEKLGLGEHHLLIFQPVPSISVIILLIIVAMAAGWFPSRKAAKLDPIEALRTE